MSNHGQKQAAGNDPTPFTFRNRDDWIRAVLADPNLTFAAKVIAARIALHLNIGSGQCDPSYATLARGTGVGRRAAMAAVASLRAAGWLASERSRATHPNNFALVFARFDHPETVHQDAPVNDEVVHGDAPVNDRMVNGGAPVEVSQLGAGASACTTLVNGGAPHWCTAVHPNNEENNERNNEEERYLSPQLFDTQSGASRECTSAPNFKTERGKEKNNRAPRVPIGSRGSRRKPSVPIPDDWVPDLDFAEHRGLNGQQEAERFRNHALANDRRCVDWQAAWRNWCLRAVDFKKPTTGGPLIDQFGNGLKGARHAVPRPRGRTFMEVDFDD